MSPVYQAGDYVISLAPRVLSIDIIELHVGNIVVVHHPGLGVIVKRIAQMQYGQIKLEGANSYSASSSSMGWVDDDCVIGRVVWHIPAERKARTE